ncbi:MAG: sigma-70 family RNA polymerase sigma factor [Schwartzia sp.]|nr:sigma-70 family RNA polymerase sigma factor [Schwartzia sp. (in: firmicutes)]
MNPGCGEADFAEIYEAYFPKVYHYIYSCLLHREVAEDVTAEVFFAALRSFAFYDPARGAMSTWISAIARNRVRNYFQKAHVRYEIPQEEPLPEETPDLPADGADSLRDPENQVLHRILQKLSPEERDFLELRFGLGLTYGEIGGLLGVSSEGVRKRYDRLLEKCRRLGNMK